MTVTRLQGVEMFPDKMVYTVGYWISGGTSATGATQIVKNQIINKLPHDLYWGFTLSEIALVVGIAGTIATMVFQFLNYRHNKRMRAEALKALIKQGRDAIIEDAIANYNDDAANSN